MWKAIISGIAGLWFMWSQHTSKKLGKAEYMNELNDKVDERRKEIRKRSIEIDEEISTMSDAERSKWM